MSKDQILTSQQEAVNESRRKLQENRAREWGLYGVSMGIDALNLGIGGHEPTKVTVIAGRSGHGKSALLNSFFEPGVTVRGGKKAHFLVLSWEMSPNLLIDREICRRVGITQSLFTQGAKLLGEATLKKVQDVYDSCANFPIEYQTMSTNLSTVRKLTYEFVERCKIAEQKEGVEIQPVIIIDYLQMFKEEGSGTRTILIANFMNGIKSVANETGCSYTVIGQLGRNSDSQELPDRQNLSDSKSIEDACDNLVLIHRPAYLGQATIIDPKTGGEVPSTYRDEEGKVIGVMLLRKLKARGFSIGDELINCDIAHFRFWGRDVKKWNEDFHYKYQSKAFWMGHFKLTTEVNKQLDLKNTIAPF